MQQCLPPSVTTDVILEMNETFSLVLTSSDDVVTLEPFPNTTVIIVDNGSTYSCLNLILCTQLVYFPFTAVIVGFELTNYTVLESVTTANVCVVLTGEIERMVDVMIFTPVTSSGKQPFYSSRLWWSV